MTGQLFVVSWILMLVGDLLDPLEYVQWLFEDPALSLCRAVSVGGRRLFWRWSLWIVTLLFVCLHLSSSSPIVLLFLFFLLPCLCTLSKTTMFIVQSSLRSFVRSFVRSSHVWSVYCLQYSCQRSQYDLHRKNVWKDRQLSCNGSRSYIPMAWNFLQEYDTCVTSCVLIPPLCSLFQKYILTSTVFLFQPMNEWMTASYDMTDSLSMTMTLCWFVPDHGSSVKNRYSSVV